MYIMHLFYQRYIYIYITISYIINFESHRIVIWNSPSSWKVFDSICQGPRPCKCEVQAAEMDSVKFMPAIQSQCWKNTFQSFVAYFFQLCNCILNPGDASWLCDTYSGHAERVNSQVDRIYLLPQIKAPLWNCYAGRYSAQIFSSTCNCIHVRFHCCA